METQFVSILAVVDVSVKTCEHAWTHAQCSFDILLSSGFKLRRVSPCVSTSWVLGTIDKSHSCAVLTVLPICWARALPSLSILANASHSCYWDDSHCNQGDPVSRYSCNLRSSDSLWCWWFFWYILYRNSHLGPLATFKLLYLFSCYWVGSLHILNIGLFPDLFCKHSLFVRECCLALLIVSLAVGSFLVWCNSTCLFFLLLLPILLWAY